MIETLGLESFRGLLDTTDNCCVLMRDFFVDQISIIEDRITVFMLSRRVYCHNSHLGDAIVRTHTVVATPRN